MSVFGRYMPEDGLTLVLVHITVTLAKGHAPEPIGPLAADFSEMVMTSFDHSWRENGVKKVDHFTRFLSEDRLELFLEDVQKEFALLWPNHAPMEIKIYDFLLGARKYRSGHEN